MTDLDFTRDKDLAKDFLQNFADADGEAKYINILQDVANRKMKAVQIDIEDLFDYKDLDEEFVGRVTSNTRRYVGIFADAIDELVPEPTEVLPDDDHDILMTQRAEEGNENADGTDPRQQMPPEIKRFYEVYIRASSKGQPFTIREVRASNIGQLVKISGIATRCSDVKPLMKVAVYTCEECGFEIYQEVTARVFMPLFECPSNRCKVNRAKGNLILQLRASKFLKFQEAKIQELAEHVPKGHIPRTMTVHFRGELTRKVAPGDVVELSGIFLPIPYTGFRAMRAGLVADTYLEAMSVSHFKKKYEEYELKGDKEEQISQLAEDGDIYSKLARSLAPEIFGHEDIKKALLLLLVGAPHRKLKDGMKIRGDLHICLMGDPGVAKSQLLKHIINVAPRGVYTTGKGSSGVGLTAAVQKDPVTNEMVLEGGALVLADMGICAIDEFDKMDESDRTAIHEVMEQQTVSIAKAGITTSLNARTAVLAAANPAWGRYDLRRTPCGHDFEGLSYTADVPFVMLDLNRMRSVDVDFGNRTAWVQGGAVLGEVYYAISNKTDSLYFPAGLCSTVGVGGYLSGGGYGNLIRKYGTGADNVIDVQFMNVNGVILNRKSMGEDLFWAIRGGGASSFGIVLAWKLRLVPVPDLVSVFLVTKTLEEGATEILHKFQYAIPSGDRNLSIRVTISSAFIGNTTTQTINIMFQGLYLGKIDKLLSLMNKTLPELNLTREDCEEVTMAQSSIVFNGLPSDTPLEFLKSRVTSVPLNTRNKLDYVRTAIPIHGLRKIWTKMFENDVGAATLILHPFGGRNDEISETAIPYPHRAGVLYQFHQSVTFSDQASDTTPASLRRINWLRSFNDLIAPYVSRNPREAYSNYNDLDLGFEAGSYEQASVWGERYWKRHNFKKLISIKAIVDPENFFRHPQSIPVFPTYLLKKRQPSSIKEPYSSL